MNPVSAYSLTFGEVAENHIKNQQIGQIANEGFTKSELSNAKKKFKEAGVKSDLYHLNRALSKEVADDAYILVVHDALTAFGIDKNALLDEQTRLVYDKKALMRGEVKNKLARHNIVMSDCDQMPNYAEGKGTIVSFDKLPLLNEIRQKLPEFLGTKAANLHCEGNKYFDVTKCGIGFHGDGERRIVVAFRLGASHPLEYQWFFNHSPVGSRISFKFNHGDMYVMSEKAVGNDWKRSSILTLRHAAGCHKYLSTDK